MAAPYSLKELAAVVLARDLQPEDRVIQTGANLPEARAAAVLANVQRLGDARIVLDLAVSSVAMGRELPRIYPASFDPRTVRSGEARLQQYELFDYMIRPDVFFVGGFQVDRRGNVNILGIRDEAGDWTLRGPGALALATMSTHCRGYYILMPRHQPRTFVDRVSLVVALGDRREREAAGLPGGGPRMVISDLGVCRFDEDGEMVVETLHPGVCAGDIRRATGFDLRVPSGVEETEPPSAEELRLLREQIDVDGLLRAGR